MRWAAAVPVVPVVLLVLLLVGAGCGARRRTTEARLAVRDSVTLRAEDSITMRWDYRIETIYVRDTIRKVIEEGSVAAAAGEAIRIDSVLVVERDTVEVRPAAPEPSPASSGRRWWIPWGVGIAVMVGLLLFLHFRNKV